MNTAGNHSRQTQRTFRWWVLLAVLGLAIPIAALHGRALGFDGKTLIHPDQVAVANEVFAPPDADIAWARKIIAAFDQPENKGKGVITVEGRMVELLHAEMAHRTVAIAEAIAQGTR